MRAKRGFTLIELLVVIAIIAILAAILFPVFAKVKTQALATQCKSNMRQIGTAFMAYTSDYNGCYPDQTSTGLYTYTLKHSDPNQDRGDWLNNFGKLCQTKNGKPAGMALALRKYLKNNDVWRCKAQYKWSSKTEKNTNSSYTYKLALMWYAYTKKRPFNISEAVYPTRASLVFEDGWHGGYKNPYSSVKDPNGVDDDGPYKLFNAVFLDGHVSRIIVNKSTGTEQGDAQGYDAFWYWGNNHKAGGNYDISKGACDNI